MVPGAKEIGGSYILFNTTVIALIPISFVNKNIIGPDIGILIDPVLIAGIEGGWPAITCAQQITAPVHPFINITVKGTVFRVASHGSEADHLIIEIIGSRFELIRVGKINGLGWLIQW